MKNNKSTLTLFGVAIGLYLVAPFLSAFIDFMIVSFADLENLNTTVVQVQPISATRQMIAMPHNKVCRIGDNIKYFSRNMSHHNLWLIDGYTITKMNGKTMCRWKGTCGSTALLIIEDLPSTNITEDIFEKAFRNQK